jgi:hypothetical protein
MDPETAVYNLMQRDPSIIAAAVVKGSKEIVYTTDNWDISGDISRVVSSWSGQNASFIMLSGVKYSMLQCEQQRMVATSIKGEGHICAAKDDEYKLICYLEPDGDARGATMDIQRAISDMSTQTVYMDSKADLGSKGAAMGGAASAGGGGGTTPATGGGGSVDPQLKGEIQALLDWIKDSEGLSGYIQYYLDQNNAQIISEMAKIYAELRQIFGV